VLTFVDRMAKGQSEESNEDQTVGKQLRVMSVEQGPKKSKVKLDPQTDDIYTYIYIYIHIYIYIYVYIAQSSSGVGYNNAPPYSCISPTILLEITTLRSSICLQRFQVR